jgi:hypothetical protein
MDSPFPEVELLAKVSGVMMAAAARTAAAETSHRSRRGRRLRRGRGCGGGVRLGGGADTASGEREAKNVYVAGAGTPAAIGEAETDGGTVGTGTGTGAFRS